MGELGCGIATDVSLLVAFFSFLAGDKDSQGGSSANRLLVL